MLRGQAFRMGTAHFWLGIGLLLVLAGAAFVRYRTVRRGAPTHGPVLLASGTLALGLVVVQGYLGGRMTYDQGVGIESGGQLAQTAVGAERLAVALASDDSQAHAGQMAFSAQGLGCARCHGDRAQGMRAPSLAAGADPRRFLRKPD